MTAGGDDSKKPGGTGKDPGESSDLSREMTAATPSPGAGSRGAPASSFASGTTLDHFEVLELLGAGGFGEVYRARDTRLGRMVAIKVLPEDFARDVERRERFRREAMAASLRLARLVQTGGVGQDLGGSVGSLTLVGCRSGQRAVHDPVDRPVQNPAEQQGPDQSADDRQERADQPPPLSDRRVVQLFGHASRRQRRQDGHRQHVRMWVGGGGRERHTNIFANGWAACMPAGAQT